MMKKLLVIFIIGVLLGYNAFAQKIKPSEVSRILLTTHDGGLSGSKDITIEVLKEHGRWNCYQISKDVFNSDEGGEPTMYSTERKQIATLTQQQIVDFLNSIAVIKPNYTLNTFDFSPSLLIAGLRKNIKREVNESPKLEAVITETSMEQALESIIKDVPVFDLSMHCDISVVKKNRGILKMETNHLYVTMLPWKVNGQDSYDMNINRFFIAAMGEMKYPNKDALSQDALKDLVFDNIDSKYAAKPIAFYRWNYTYADNISLLKSNFSMVDKYYILGGGTVLDCSFQSNTMPPGIRLTGMVDIANRTDIERLIAYNNYITPYLKADNFVFKYYRDKPGCNISILYHWNKPENYEWEWLEKKIPYLKTMDPDKIIQFQVYAPDDSSSWLLLPDSKLILVTHSFPTPPLKGPLAAMFPPPDANAPERMPAINKTYGVTFFNTDGSVLNNPPR